MTSWVYELHQLSLKRLLGKYKSGPEVANDIKLQLEQERRTKQQSQTKYKMANFCSLYAFLISGIFLTSIGLISCTSIQKVMLHHEYSGRFLEGTPSSGPVTATGGISGKLYHGQIFMCIICTSSYEVLMLLQVQNFTHISRVIFLTMKAPLSVENI